MELQLEFGLVLPDPKLVENEVQIKSQHPVGAYGLYDLYPGTYLGKDVWCKKLSYGDPQGKAKMVKTLFQLLVSWLKWCPLQRFRRELDIWSKLWKKDQEQRRQEGTLPRILPLYGFYMPYDGAM